MTRPASVAPADQANEDGADDEGPPHHLRVAARPPGPRVICTCLLVEAGGWLALVDAGIGLEDARRPLERVVDLPAFGG